MDRAEAERLAAERAQLRRSRDYEAADAIRRSLRAGGWEVADSAAGSQVRLIEAPAANASATPRTVTALTIVHGWQADAERWLFSVFNHCQGDFEAVMVDNSGDPRIAGWLNSRAAERLRIVSLQSVGFGTAVNAGLDAAAGEVVVLFDPGVELTGDAVSPLLAALSEPDVALAGAFGLRAAGSLKEFVEASGPDADAIEGYCMAFRRPDAIAAGGFDARFQFYRIADIEFSFRMRDRFGRAVVVPHLPLAKHDHQLWESTAPNERERLSRRNMYRFLDRWGGRTDLMIGP